MTTSPYDISDLPNLRGPLHDDLDTALRITNEYVTRGRQAIETAPFANGAHREAAMRVLDSSSEKHWIADHILRTGSPAYVSGFNKFVANPTEADVTSEEVSALNRFAFRGGYTLPFFIDPTLCVKDAASGSSNPIRNLATVKTITTDTWHGVYSVATAAYLAGDNDKVGFEQATIQPHRGDAFLQASIELLEGTLPEQVVEMISAARDRLETQGFALGTGNRQPQGLKAGIVANEIDNSFSQDMMLSLMSGLPPRYRVGAVWLGERADFNTIAVDLPTHWTPGNPPLLNGMPCYEHPDMGGTVVFGNVHYGYYVIDKLGMSLSYTPLSHPEDGPLGVGGWYAAWKVGGAVVDSNAFRCFTAPAGIWRR